MMSSIHTPFPRFTPLTFGQAPQPKSTTPASKTAIPFAEELSGFSQTFTKLYPTKLPTDVLNLSSPEIQAFQDKQATYRDIMGAKSIDGIRKYQDPVTHLFINFVRTVLNVCPNPDALINATAQDLETTPLYQRALHRHPKLALVTEPFDIAQRAIGGTASEEKAKLLADFRASEGEKTDAECKTLLEKLGILNPEAASKPANEAKPSQA